MLSLCATSNACVRDQTWRPGDAYALAHTHACSDTTSIHFLMMTFAAFQDASDSPCLSLTLTHTHTPLWKDSRVISVSSCLRVTIALAACGRPLERLTPRWVELTALPIRGRGGSGGDGNSAMLVSRLWCSFETLVVPLRSNSQRLDDETRSPVWPHPLPLCLLPLLPPPSI